MSDSTQGADAQVQRDGNLGALYGLGAPTIVEGTIVDVVAGQRYYKVQIPGDEITCRDITVEGGMHPLGPRKLHVYQVGSRVLVFHCREYRNGFILGATPFLISQNPANIVDSIAAFTGADSYNDMVHNYPLLMPFAGGIFDYNSGRPVDAIPGSDAGMINELGVGYGMSRTFSWMRASEICGVWFNYYDYLCRLFAWNWEFMTSGGEHWIRNDEGEIAEYQWSTPFPWEASGLLDPGAAFTESEKGGWYSPGQYDNRLRPRVEDQIGIGRHLRFGGYLGDIEREMVVVPEAGKVPVPHRLDDDTRLAGVLDIHKGIDGTFALRSARQVLIERTILIPVPKQTARPEENSEAGDSTENYRPAGLAGEGEAHTKTDWQWQEPTNPVGWAAQLADYHSYMFNWYGILPLVRHEKDWHVPEESESGPGDGGHSRLYNPGPLTSQWSYSAPPVQILKVDHRAEATKYYMSRSFLDLLPDGSAMLQDGYNSAFHMSGGHMFLAPPGDIYLMPGRNIIAMAGSDVNIKGGKSVDISAAKRDVRIKAERNLHVLGGNEGDGGVLIESRTSGADTFRFSGVAGEDVESSGIVLLARNSQVLAYGDEVYLRSTGGGVVCDADGGDEDCVSIGKRVMRWAKQDYVDYAGVVPSEDTEPSLDNTAVNIFSKDQMILGAKSFMHVSAATVVYGRQEGNVQFGVDGNVSAAGTLLSERGLFCGGQALMLGSLAVKGSVVSSGSANMSGQVGKLKDPPLEDLDPPEIKDQVEESAAVGQTTQAAALSRTTQARAAIYGSGMVGHDGFISILGFSCRTEAQYSVQGLALPEAPYQQLFRIANTGVVYEEPEVDAPWGFKTRPWPGSIAWEEDKAYRTYDPSLFDTENGYSKDRGGSNAAPYEAATGANVVTPAKLAEAYRVSKQE